MRHPLSFSLRTMSGLVNRSVLDGAADELDRLHNLTITTAEQASITYSQHRRHVEQLQARIKELERAVSVQQASAANNA